MDMTHLIYLYGAVKKLNVFLLGEWDNYDRDRGTLKEMGNVFKGILRNSHTVYLRKPERGKGRSEERREGRERRTRWWA